jgi:NitT/TauT family transport system substrate-binding protein
MRAAISASALLQGRRIHRVRAPAARVASEEDRTRHPERNPEDTLRFHALRQHEVGMIKTAPQKLIAQGTDWRFLNELKKELKA